jgi:hypothetical protein
MVLFGQSLESDPEWIGENVDRKHTYTPYNIFYPLCQVCAKVTPEGEGEGGEKCPVFSALLTFKLFKFY